MVSVWGGGIYGGGKHQRSGLACFSLYTFCFQLGIVQHVHRYIYPVAKILLAKFQSINGRRESCSETCKSPRDTLLLGKHITSMNITGVGAVFHILS